MNVSLVSILIRISYKLLATQGADDLDSFVDPSPVMEHVVFLAEGFTAQIARVYASMDEMDVRLECHTRRERLFTAFLWTLHV